MEVIILRVTPYKEKDGIIEAISSEGTMSFLLRGLLDPKSKNSPLNNPLTIADVEISEGKYKYPVVKSSMVLVNPINLQYDLTYLAVMMTISEATINLLTDEEKGHIFRFLYQTIIDLKNGTDPVSICISYLAKILKISGYDFGVNECIMCGSKKNIVTFSFNDGGFICGECYTPDIPKLFNKNQMLILREAFKSEATHVEKGETTDDERVFVLHKFFEFIFDSYNYKMKSKDLFK